MVAQWKQAIQQSLEKNKVPFAKFFQLATIRPDGRPANRTVVYRGFEDDTEKILFTTHTRSRKMEDFNTQPRGEICWYFTETQEQYRLNGKMDVLDESSEGKDQQIRKDNWEHMSGSLRAWFGGPPPSAPKTDSGDSGEGEAPPASEPPVSAFAVVRMDVEEVDYVDLANNQRQLYKRGASGGGWQEQALNP